VTGQTPRKKQQDIILKEQLGLEIANIVHPLRHSPQLPNSPT